MFVIPIQLPPEKPVKADHEIVYQVKQVSKSPRAIVDSLFVQKINNVRKILDMPKILGGEKREMEYELRQLYRNIKNYIIDKISDKTKKKEAKRFLLEPVKRCMKLVKEKGFCHTQRNLMKTELADLLNKFVYIEQQVGA